MNKTKSLITSSALLSAGVIRLRTADAKFHWRVQHQQCFRYRLGGGVRAHVHRASAISTENQLDTIRIYAATHALEINKVCTDAGKSGLRLEGRDALKQLFFDVEKGLADYSTVLVYDVSRWGRFQDPDVSASY